MRPDSIHKLEHEDVKSFLLGGFIGGTIEAAANMSQESRIFAKERLNMLLSMVCRLSDKQIEDLRKEYNP